MLSLLAAVLILLPARARGEAERGSIEVDGETREFLYHLPAKPAERPPLVFILHGGGGTARHMEDKLLAGAFDRLSDQEGFIAVYPEGVGKNWNDGRVNSRRTVRRGTDEKSFFLGMIGWFEARHKADPSRVYAAGISNGGFMSLALACGLPGKFAGVAAVAASMPAGLAGTCAQGPPVSVLLINGDEDRLVHWEGGEVTGPWGFKRFGRADPVESAFSFWSGREACRPQDAREGRLDADEKDGTVVEFTVRRCERGRVGLFKVVGGGHTWPGGAQYLPRFMVGRTSREFDASAIIWGFFKGEPVP